MKFAAPLLLAGLLVLSGCANHYVMTLNNGAQLTSKGKPVLKDGAFNYKDLSGQERSVPEGRVREVSPASMVEQPAKAKSTVKPTEKKHWYFLWLA
jgi:hypothetical protein